MVFKYFFCMMCLILTTPMIKAEVFTATSDLEPLIDTLGNVVQHLEKYLQNEKNRLKLLKKQLHMYKKVHISSMKDVSKYLENPVNSFTIIKRLTVDLNFTVQIIEMGKENVEKMYKLSNATLFPTLEDLTGSVSALSRLQNTYELNVSDLANGRLAGEECSNPMSASDCFILGQTLFNDTNYEHALQWLKEALHKYEIEKDDYDLNLIEILKYISNAYYNLDHVESALEWNEKILKLNPTNTEALNDMVEFQKSLYEDNDIFEEENSTEPIDDRDFIKNVLAADEQIYAALCRGDIEIHEKRSKRLKCRYFTENHPFLKLAPIKMEQLHMKPDIFLFHQVINDNEIEHIKNMTKHNFRRATIVNPAGGNQIPTLDRISKTGWLSDNESSVVERITQRVSDFTGLDMKTAESLQIANYGIGGHYVPHFDFTLSHMDTDEAFGENVGNRIATVLFYMSDVPQGGGTAFMELGFSVLPVKNAALFWMNLHPSGEGNIATRHAACPVLLGSKWVSNKWIHQYGQELIKPCDLEYQKESDKRSPVSVKIKTKNQDLEKLIYNWYRGLEIQKAAKAPRVKRKLNK